MKEIKNSGAEEGNTKAVIINNVKWQNFYKDIKKIKININESFYSK